MDNHAKKFHPERKEHSRLFQLSRSNQAQNVYCRGNNIPGLFKPNISHHAPNAL